MIKRETKILSSCLMTVLKTSFSFLRKIEHAYLENKKQILFLKNKMDYFQRIFLNVK